MDGSSAVGPHRGANLGNFEIAPGTRHWFRGPYRRSDPKTLLPLKIEKNQKICEPPKGGGSLFDPLAPPPQMVFNGGGGV